MSNATPTPWKVFTTPDGRKIVGIGAEDGGGILDAGFGVWRWKDDEGMANAELVVRAVNSHDELLAALKAACGYMRNASIDLSTGCTKATAIRTIEGGLKLAEAVIAKVDAP